MGFWKDIRDLQQQADAAPRPARGAPAVPRVDPEPTTTIGDTAPAADDPPVERDGPVKPRR